MRRISTATKVVDKFGTGKHGFTNGNAVGGIAATDLEDVWFDSVQEEIAAVIEDLGVALDPNNRAQLLAALKGRLINVRTFTASGTYTRTQGTKFVIVEVQGGGGGGGASQTTLAANQCSAGAAGGPGAWASGIIQAANLGATEAVTVGGAGVGGTTSGASGTGGATSSFGTHITATGGGGGSGGDAPIVASARGNSPGVPGTATVAGTVTNVLSNNGRSGTYPVRFSSGAVIGSQGGSSQLSCGASGTNEGGNGMNAPGYGGGGSGGASGSSGTDAFRTGGNGSQGIVIVREYA